MLAISANGFMHQIYFKPFHHHFETLSLVIVFRKTSVFNEKLIDQMLLRHFQHFFISRSDLRLQIPGRWTQQTSGNLNPGKDPFTRDKSTVSNNFARLALQPGACIIKLITTVIYGFSKKLEYLSLNTRLGWKRSLRTNTSLLQNP